MSESTFSKTLVAMLASGVLWAIFGHHFWINISITAVGIITLLLVFWYKNR